MHASLFLLLAANVDPAALTACTTVDDDRQRLACYDALLRPAGPSASATTTAGATTASPVAAASSGAAAAPVAAAPSATGAAVGAATAPATAGQVIAAPVIAAAAVPVPVNPVDEFGLSAEQQLAKKEPEKKQKLQEVDSINARVAVVRKLRNDRFVLILENDQIWTQVEPTPRQRFYVGDDIEIRRAAMGSFLATGPNAGGAIRVRRVE